MCSSQPECECNKDLLPLSVCAESSLISRGKEMSCGLWKETLALAEDYLSPVPAPSPRPAPRSQRVSRCHEVPGPGHGGAAPGPLPLPRSELPQAVWAGPLLQPQEGDRGAGGRWTLELGRVVSLFTFTGVLARQLQEQKGVKLGQDPGQEPGPEPGSCRGLAETIADYLGEEKKDWMLENDGWEGFCSFSRTARGVSQDSSMKTALMAVAGVGLAGLTFLLVR